MTMSKPGVHSGAESFMSQPIKSKTPLWQELFYVGIIALVGFKLIYSVTDVVDILFYDETIYLTKGLDFLSFLFKDGFVYYGWYKFLSLFLPDNVTLYYANYILLMLLNPFLIYVLLRKLKVQPFWSGLFSIVFLVSNMNVAAWPYITRFALAWILFMFIGILSVQDRKKKYLIALFGLSLLVYIRPEYFLTLILFTLAGLLFLAIRYRKTRNPIIVYFIILTIIVSGFVVFVKNPARAGRSNMAFGQHYAIHLNLIGKVTVNPSTNWKQIMQENFGTHESLVQAFFNNPREMIRHVIYNIKIMPYQSLRHAFPYSKEFENSLPKKIVWAIGLLLALLFIIMGIRKKIKEPLIDGEPAQTDETIFYFLSIILLIPLVVSIVIVFPREHYLLVIFAIILINVAKNVPSIPLTFKWKWVQYPLMLVVLFVAPWQVTGSAGILPGEYTSLHQEKCTNIKRIRFLNRLKINSQKVLLSTGGSMECYVKNLTHVDEQRKKVPFKAFLEERGINMIRLSYGLLTDTRFVNDKEFKAFLKDLPNNRWTKIKISDCAEEVAIRRDILEDATKP